MNAAQIRDDPEPSFGLSDYPSFQRRLFPPEHEGDIARILNWESVSGVVLSLHFSEGSAYSIDGSAVMVGPGIAICAKHVVDDHLEGFRLGTKGGIASGILASTLQLWRIVEVIGLEGCDIAILCLTYAAEVPANRIFFVAAMTERPPEIGEKLMLLGFRADVRRVTKNANNYLSHGGMLVASGIVSAQFPSGRDRTMLPGPCVQIECKAFGGMSGGPAFGKDGTLIGIVSSSYDDGPTFVSLLSPAFEIWIRAGWPAAFFPKPTTLKQMDRHYVFV